MRFLRLKAEDSQPGFEGVLSDSELLLADPSFDRRSTPIVLGIRAEGLIQVRRFGEAVAAATQALDIDEWESAALFARGWAADSALVDLNRALQMDPDEGIAYFRRACIFQHQGEFDLNRALQLAPGDGPSRRGAPSSGSEVAGTLIDVPACD